MSIAKSAKYKKTTRTSLGEKEEKRFTAFCYLPAD